MPQTSPSPITPLAISAFITADNTLGAESVRSAMAYERY